MKKKWTFESKYLTFWWGGSFTLTYSVCGYFSNLPAITLGLLLFTLTIRLPFPNRWKDECDPPRYGIGYHSQIFWIYLGGKGNMNGGGKWIAINMPWSYDWVRTSVLLKDGTWAHEVRKGTKKDFWKDEWKDKTWSETHPYRYTLKNGQVQERNARITVEEREWRMRWSRWTSWMNRVRRTINVEFSDEVGERTGSWKGGTIGCGYDLKGNETPRQCLERMMVERTFD